MTEREKCEARMAAAMLVEISGIGQFTQWEDELARECARIAADAVEDACDQIRQCEHCGRYESTPWSAILPDAPGPVAEKGEK